MRIEIYLKSREKQGLIVPADYAHLIQGFIYNNLSKQNAEFLHNTGFQYEKRKFKLFAFSRLQGVYRYDRSKNLMNYKNGTSFVFSTPVSYIIEDLASNLFKSDEFFLGRNRCALASVNVEKKTKMEKTNMIRFLSPVTMYSTLFSPNNTKKTYYYNPFEKEFSQLISENIRKKYTAFYGKPAGNLKIDLTPHKVNNRNLQIVKYRGGIIKGWTGIYKLSGSKKLMKLAYDTGLGSKNSQGFGVFKILNTNGK